MAANNKKTIQFSDTLHAGGIKNLSFADALSAQQEVALFSPALLITHGGFDRDPVKEYNAFAPPENADQEPFCIDLRFKDHAFFSGLGRSQATPYMPSIDWDQRLYGLDRRRTEECFAFIRGIAFKQPNGRLFQSFSHEIVVPDPTLPEKLSQSNGDKMRWMVVTIFGVFTFCYAADTDYRAKVAYIENATGVPSPKVKHFETDDDMRAFFALRGATMFERNFNELGS